MLNIYRTAFPWANRKGTTQHYKQLFKCFYLCALGISDGYKCQNIKNNKTQNDLGSL